MTYHVHMTDLAKMEAGEAYFRMQQHSSTSAERWLTGLQDAIESLAQLPERCPLAPESLKYKKEIRQLFYGKRAKTYRILFEVQEGTVFILHIRHGLRSAL